jgi:heme-degrading monooxygenase HmoA
MAIYQSMQRVRFSSPDGYEKFKVVFADVRRHLKTLPGFLHLTWWIHPEDPGWHNEVSFWTSFEALKDWHMNPYHKHAKEWAVRTGAIMEDIITNFELKSTRLIRVCPCCGQITDTPYDLAFELEALAAPCSKCGYHFPVMPETANSSAVFKSPT